MSESTLAGLDQAAAKSLLDRAREAWKRGDRAWVVRQHEWLRVLLERCRCDRGSCGGCIACLKIMGQLEKAGEASELTDEQIQAAQRTVRVTAQREQEALRARLQAISDRVSRYQRHDTAVAA